MALSCPSIFFFFFNDTATTEIYTLSLHDALPISSAFRPALPLASRQCPPITRCPRASRYWWTRSEEHTSELQSRPHLVCRLLLEKKKHCESNDLHHIISAQASELFTMPSRQQLVV